MVTLNNIMANENNGYFPAILTNCTWQSSTYTPEDGAKMSVRIIPNGGGECCLTSAKHSLISNHKYYLSLKLKFESAVNGTVDWYWPIAEPAAVSGLSVKGEANQWIRCSAIFTREMFSDGDYQCRFDYNNETVNIPFRFTSCMLVDLTEVFGEGKEPSKEWLDDHIISFNDSLSIHYIENLSELFKNIADAIRSKDGTTDLIYACDFADRIKKI